MCESKSGETIGRAVLCVGVFLNACRAAIVIAHDAVSRPSQRHALTPCVFGCGSMRVNVPNDGYFMTERAGQAHQQVPEDPHENRNEERLPGARGGGAGRKHYGRGSRRFC